MTNLGQYEDVYKQLAEGLPRWMSSAKNLFAAADLLWVSVRADLHAGDRIPDDAGNHADVAQNYGPGRPFLQHAAVYLMIAGFAVENALKAVLLRREKTAATKVTRGEMRIAKELQTHDLRRLAHDAGISLSQAEYDLLDRLHAYLVWAGRYPVATTSRGQATVQNIWRNDQQVISGVLLKIESAFHGDAGADP